MLFISLSLLRPEFLDILATRCVLPGRGDVWLPRLMTLYTVGGTPNVHYDIVRMRMDAGVPLRSLYVTRYTNIDEHIVVWLRENLETFECF